MQKVNNGAEVDPSVICKKSIKSLDSISISLFTSAQGLESLQWCGLLLCPVWRRREIICDFFHVKVSFIYLYICLFYLLCWTVSCVMFDEWEWGRKCLSKPSSSSPPSCFFFLLCNRTWERRCGLAGAACWLACRVWPPYTPPRRPLPPLWWRRCTSAPPPLPAATKPDRVVAVAQRVHVHLKHKDIFRKLVKTLTWTETWVIETDGQRISVFFVFVEKRVLQEGEKVWKYLWESKQCQSFWKPVSDVSHLKIVDKFFI